MIAIYELHVEIDMENLEVDVTGHETMFPFEYIALCEELQKQYLDIVIEKRNK